MKNILCYGDSNTFGFTLEGGRHPYHIRWTGRLQQALGPEYRVIEEGCGGRTTVFEDEIDLGRNGRTSLPVCLNSHKPLDLVILMLGTNDMKNRFQNGLHRAEDPGGVPHSHRAGREPRALCRFSARRTGGLAPAGRLHRARCPGKRLRLF